MARTIPSSHGIRNMRWCEQSHGIFILHLSLFQLPFLPSLTDKRPRVWHCINVMCLLLIQPVYFPAHSDLCLKCKECFNHSLIIPLIAATLIQPCRHLQIPHDLPPFKALGHPACSRASLSSSFSDGNFYFFLINDWINLLCMKSHIT